MMRSLSSCLDVTRMWRRTDRASLEKKPSTRLSHEPCFREVGVNDFRVATEQRELSTKRYVYVWADGIHLETRLEDAKQCILAPGNRDFAVARRMEGERYAP